MTAFPCLPEKDEALRRLSARTAQSVAIAGEPDLEISRQAAALRAQALWQFVAAFRVAFRQSLAASGTHSAVSS